MVGQTRERLAELLEVEMDYPVDPNDLRPVTGSWRTDVRLDVQRWDASLPGGYMGKSMCAGSWHTMTELVKMGVSVQYDTGSLEVYPLNHDDPSDLEHFKWQRLARRNMRRGDPLPTPPRATFGELRKASDIEAQERYARDYPNSKINS